MRLSVVENIHKLRNCIHIILLKIMLSRGLSLQQSTRKLSKASIEEFERRCYLFSALKFKQRLSIQFNHRVHYSSPSPGEKTPSHFSKIERLYKRFQMKTKFIRVQIQSQQDQALALLCSLSCRSAEEDSDAADAAAANSAASASDDPIEQYILLQCNSKWLLHLLQSSGHEVYKYSSE